MNLKLVIPFFLLFCTFVASSQNKYEREFRIKKSQFPQKAIALISKELKGARHLKFYKEIDSSKSSFEAKFKKDKLWYSVEFDNNGVFEDVEINVKAVDIPTDTFTGILNHLEKTFSKYRIKKIQQQYPFQKEESIEKTIKNAFQNLLLPTINYELIIAGKKEKEYFDYELLFNAKGEFISIRKSLPPNYDHILY